MSGLPGTQAQTRAPVRTSNARTTPEGSPSNNAFIPRNERKHSFHHPLS